MQVFESGERSIERRCRLDVDTGTKRTITGTGHHNCSTVGISGSGANRPAQVVEHVRGEGVQRLWPVESQNLGWAMPLRQDVRRLSPHIAHTRRY